MPRRRTVTYRTPSGNPTFFKPSERCPTCEELDDPLMVILLSSLLLGGAVGIGVISFLIGYITASFLSCTGIPLRY